MNLTLRIADHGAVVKGGGAYNPQLRMTYLCSRLSSTNQVVFVLLDFVLESSRQICILITPPSFLINISKYRLARSFGY
jgi:hypothetical protein